MKLANWNASPSAIAPVRAASVSLGSRIGSICSPITAAEPYMYRCRSANVVVVDVQVHGHGVEKSVEGVLRDLPAPGGVQHRGDHRDVLVWSVATQARSKSRRRRPTAVAGIGDPVGCRSVHDLVGVAGKAVQGMDEGRFAGGRSRVAR